MCKINLYVIPLEKHLYLPKSLLPEEDRKTRTKRELPFGSSLDD